MNEPVYGAGAIGRLPTMVARLSPRSVLLVTDAGLMGAGIAGRVLDLLEAAGLGVAVFDAVPPNPRTTDVRAGVDRAHEANADMIVALGGGSVMDTAKGIALGTAHAAPVPIVAIPTTAGTGAETNGFGVIEDPATKVKTYVGNATVRPAMVVLDPELTLGLPPGPTAATGMDALVHGLESLASRRSGHLSAAYATQALSLVSGNLLAVVEDGSDLAARGKMLLGAHLAGRAFSLSGLGLVHGLAHAITNHTGAVHGLALSAMLPEVMACAGEAAEPAYAVAADAMELPGRGDVSALRVRHLVETVRELSDEIGARSRLSELGADRSMVTTIATGALVDTVSVNHPIQLPTEQVEELLVSRL